MDLVDIWIRVSDANQTAKSQLPDIKQYIKHKGWQLRKTWVISHSGWKGEIPERKEIFKQARLGKFKHFVVWAIDRWTRKGADALMKDLKLFTDYGVQFHSIQESFLDYVNMPGVGEYLREFIIKLFAWQAEQESRKKSNRLRISYKQKKREAHKTGKPLKWGKRKKFKHPDKIIILKAYTRLKSIRKVGKELGVSKSYIHNVIKLAALKAG